MICPSTRVSEAVVMHDVLCDEMPCAPVAEAAGYSSSGLSIRDGRSCFCLNCRTGSGQACHFRISQPARNVLPLQSHYCGKPSWCEDVRGSFQALVCSARKKALPRTPVFPLYSPSSFSYCFLRCLSSAFNSSYHTAKWSKEQNRCLRALGYIIPQRICSMSGMFLAEKWSCVEFVLFVRRCP